MRTRRFVGLGLLVLGGATLYRWRQPVPQSRIAVFSSYSDNFAGMWGLTLYRDGGFSETLPGASNTGRFRLTGDTVELHYTAAPLPPAAYCLDRSTGKIYKLRRGPNRWLADDTGRDWSAIQLDSLPVSEF